MIHGVQTGPADMMLLAEMLDPRMKKSKATSDSQFNAVVLVYITQQ